VVAPLSFPLQFPSHGRNRATGPAPTSGYLRECAARFPTSPPDVPESLARRAGEASIRAYPENGLRSSTSIRPPTNLTRCRGGSGFNSLTAFAK
jgi:hypothetical protein